MGDGCNLKASRILDVKPTLSPSCKIRNSEFRFPNPSLFPLLVAEKQTKPSRFMKQYLPNPPAMRSDTSYSGSFLKSQEEIVTRTQSSSGNLPSLELGYLDPSGVSEGRGLFQPHLSGPSTPPSAGWIPKAKWSKWRVRGGGIALGPGKPPEAGPRPRLGWSQHGRLLGSSEAAPAPNRQHLFEISSLKTVNSQDLSTNSWRTCNQIYAFITWWKEIQGENTISAS